jgi:DNA-binding NarL/FixJ family response regulator
MSLSPPLFLVVEDHPEVASNNCRFIQKLESSAVCIPVETPLQALERLRLETPDLIVVDLQYGTRSGEQSGKPGLVFLEQIFQDYPQLNILIYTSEFSLLKSLGKPIEQHAGGFVVVSKLERRRAFLEGVRGALNGELRLPRALQQELRLQLSEQELQVLEMLCKESLTDSAIAQQMHVSLRTAQNYMQRLKVKLEIDIDEKSTSSRVALCMEAVRRKLLVL